MRGRPSLRMVPTSARPVLLNRSSPHRASSDAPSANSAQFIVTSFRPHADSVTPWHQILRPPPGMTAGLPSHPDLRSPLSRERERGRGRGSLILLQRAGIAFREAELAGLEEAAHDLAAAGLGQRGHELDLAGGGAGAQLIAREADQLAPELVVRLEAVLEGDERLHHLHPHPVRLSDDAGFGDGGVLEEGALDL